MCRDMDEYFQLWLHMDTSGMKEYDMFTTRRGVTFLLLPTSNFSRVMGCRIHWPKKLHIVVRLHCEWNHSWGTFEGPAVRIGSPYSSVTISISPIVNVIELTRSYSSYTDYPSMKIWYLMGWLEHDLTFCTCW